MFWLSVTFPDSRWHAPPGADWPMYRGDSQRTAHVEQSLALPLALAWKHQAPLAPAPAWPRCRRMTFDRAFQVVAAGDRVLFGSSADGTVTALHAASGEVCWRFFTEGPIRFAPAHLARSRWWPAMMVVCTRSSCRTVNCCGSSAEDRVTAVSWETRP